MAYIDPSDAGDFMVMGVASQREELVVLQEEIKKASQQIHPEQDPASPKEKLPLLQRIRKVFKR